MPVFDVKCAHCGTIREHNFPIDSEFSSIPCGCGSIMHKRYSPVAVSFKGSGFYSTDKRTRRIKAGTSLPL